MVKKKDKSKVLTDKNGIDADILFNEFKEHSVADFFKKNRQMLGLYGKVRTLTTIIHELVTNSLDACEEAGILPKIEVRLSEINKEHYEISVKDNGPGIPEKKIGNALGKLLAGTKFHRLVQTRGQQGIGVSGIILFSQIVTGKPTKVITGTKKGKTISLEVSIDSKTNNPKITNKHFLDNKFRGTAIKAKFKEVLYRKGQNSVDEYLRRTAIANPHATIVFENPDQEVVEYTRTVNKLPPIPKEVKPHPRGVTVDELLTLSRHSKSRKITSYLMSTFDRFGRTAVNNVQDKVHFDLNKDPKKLTWDEAEEIVKAIKKTKFIAPNTDNLVPIGGPQIKKSLDAIVEPEFSAVTTRKPAVYKGGYAFQVEVGIAYGGNAGRIVTRTTENKETSTQDVRISEIIRYANKAPLLFDAGACAITKTAQSVDWRRYGVSDFENAPISLFVNVISVHIPYTSAGKTAIADEEEITDDIKLAIMKVARKVGVYIKHKKKEAEKIEKRKVFSKYVPEIVTALTKSIDADKKELKTNLMQLVLKKLKLEEAEDKKKAAKNDVIKKARNVVKKNHKKEDKDEKKE